GFAFIRVRGRCRVKPACMVVIEHLFTALRGYECRPAEQPFHLFPCVAGKPDEFFVDQRHGGIFLADKSGCAGSNEYRTLTLLRSADRLFCLPACRYVVDQDKEADDTIFHQMGNIAGKEKGDTAVPFDMLVYKSDTFSCQCLFDVAPDPGKIRRAPHLLDRLAHYLLTREVKPLFISPVHKPVTQHLVHIGYIDRHRVGYQPDPVSHLPAADIVSEMVKFRGGPDGKEPENRLGVVLGAQRLAVKHHQNPDDTAIGEFQRHPQETFRTDFVQQPVVRIATGNSLGVETEFARDYLGAGGAGQPVAEGFDRLSLSKSSDDPDRILIFSGEFADEGEFRLQQSGKILYEGGEITVAGGLRQNAGYLFQPGLFLKTPLQNFPDKGDQKNSQKRCRLLQYLGTHPGEKHESAEKDGESDDQAVDEEQIESDFQGDSSLSKQKICSVFLGKNNFEKGGGSRF